MNHLDHLAQDHVEGRALPAIQIGGSHSLDPVAILTLREASLKRDSGATVFLRDIRNAQMSRFGIPFRISEIPTRHQLQVVRLLLTDIRREM